jgi:hypothetical protein
MHQSNTKKLGLRKHGSAWLDVKVMGWIGSYVFNSGGRGGGRVVVVRRLRFRNRKTIKNKQTNKQTKKDKTKLLFAERLWTILCQIVLKKLTSLLLHM